MTWEATTENCLSSLSQTAWWVSSPNQCLYCSYDMQCLQPEEVVLTWTVQSKHDIAPPSPQSSATLSKRPSTSVKMNSLLCIIKICCRSWYIAIHFNEGKSILYQDMTLYPPQYNILSSVLKVLGTSYRLTPCCDGGSPSSLDPHNIDLTLYPVKPFIFDSV